MSAGRIYFDLKIFFNEYAILLSTYQTLAD